MGLAKPILVDLPETIDTQKLMLQMPKAGFGQQLCEAIQDGYGDYVKWLNWPPTAPSSEDVEIECRKHHAEFILRDYIRYLIIEKASGQVIV